MSQTQPLHKEKSHTTNTKQILQKKTATAEAVPEEEEEAESSSSSSAAAAAAAASASASAVAKAATEVMIRTSPIRRLFMMSTRPTLKTTTYFCVNQQENTHHQKLQRSY
jgi:hypothetical protein